MAFIPRVTKPVEPELSTFWARPFSYQCVWYTIGRLREIANTPVTDPDRAWPVTLSSIQQAKQIYPNADESNGYIKDGNKASIGALACWDGIDGHCMNVEMINGNMITLSSYNFPYALDFALVTYDINTIINNQISGLGRFQGFVRNPYVTSINKTPIIAGIFNRIRKNIYRRRYKLYVK